MALSIDEYLSKQKGVEILCEISLNGSRFKDLDKALEMSSTTLSKHLDRGVDASLLTHELVTGEGRTSHKYLLTPKGVLVRWKLDNSGTTESYHVYKNAHQRFDQNIEGVREWLADNPDALENEEWIHTLQFHRRYMRPDSTERPYDEEYDEERLEDSE